jgi:hypothetical protein
VRPGQRRQDEALDAVSHGPREEFAQGAGILTICTTKSPQIRSSVPLVNDGRWGAVANEEKVEHQAPNSAIPVPKRVDALKGGVEIGEVLDDVAPFGWGFVRSCNPVRQPGLNVDPRGSGQPNPQRL